MVRLDGKVVLVTGGSRGLGGALASALAGAGAAVIAGSRGAPGPTPESGCRAGQVLPLALDVRSEASVLGVFDWIDRSVGRLDALVNAAGVGVFKPLLETSFAEWSEVLATDLTGAFLCAREALRRMAGLEGGRILNLGSVVDHQALPLNGAYGAAKMGLRSLNESLNLEGAAAGVRATLLSIGAVATGLWDTRPGFERADMLAPADVVRQALEILTTPLHVRIDEVRLLPPKGTL